MAQRSNEISGEEGDLLQSLDNVLERTLALGAVVAVAFDAPSSELFAWLKASGLDVALTAEEGEFLSNEMRSEKQLKNMSWQSERLLVLLWALCKIEVLPGPDEQCSIGTLEELLPPYGDHSLEEFQKTARLRSEDELFDAAVSLQDLHVIARQRSRDPSYRESSPAVDIEVIQERHHAINWLVGYGGASWDEVTTDT